MNTCSSRFLNPRPLVGKNRRKRACPLCQRVHFSPCIARPWSSAHVVLRAVLVHNTTQPTRHGNAEESHPDGPVRADAVDAVVFRVLEADEAVLSDRPGRAHTGVGCFLPSGMEFGSL